MKPISNIDVSDVVADSKRARSEKPFGLCGILEHSETHLAVVRPEAIAIAIDNPELRQIGFHATSMEPL